MEATNGLYGVKISGLGIALPGYDNLPGKIVSNFVLSRELMKRGVALADAKGLTGDTRKKFLENFETSDEWIQERTGVKERCIGADSIATSDLAIVAGKRALNEANLKPDQIDRLDIATVSPDNLNSPPTFSLVAKGLGLGGNLGNSLDGPLGTLFGCDGSAACSSFVASLQNCIQAIMTGVVEKGLVIGADVMSRTANPEDRGFMPILGDGAGAIVLERCHFGGSVFLPSNLYFGTDGAFADRIITRAGGSRMPSTEEHVRTYQDKLWMIGKKVFKEVVLLVPRVIEKALKRAGKSLGEIDVMFFHQANIRIVDAAVQRLEYKGLVYNNIDRVGNTTSAAIPLLLYEARRKGVLKKEMTFMIVVFGGGYTWGTVIGKWNLE